MPTTPPALVDPVVGEPTKVQKFAALVIQWINFLYGLITSTTSGAQLINGGFENDVDGDFIPDGWSLVLFNSGAGVIDSTDQIEGRNSFKFTHPGGGAPNGGGTLTSGATSSDFIEINENKDVYLSWWMKASVNVNLGCKVRLLWFDITESAVGVPTVLLDTTTPPLTWLSFYGKGTPPANARLMQVEITGGYQGVDPGVAANAWFDNVRIFTPTQYGKISIFEAIGDETMRVPEDCVAMYTEGVGGGGGGGGSCGAGGGCGGFISGFGGASGVLKETMLPVTPGRLLTFKKGAGGTAGAAGPASGDAGDGGDTQIVDQDGTVLLNFEGGKKGKRGIVGVGVVPAFDMVNKIVTHGSSAGITTTGGSIRNFILFGTPTRSGVGAPANPIAVGNNMPTTFGNGGFASPGQLYGGGGSGGVQPINQAGNVGARGYVMVKT